MCKDTPNFIANRLASIGGAMLVDFVLANGYTVEEVDAIAGPLIGRPKTAAFRLQDLVGLDVASPSASNLYGLIEGDESREVLRSPRLEALRKDQMDKGRLGDKSGQGFYKKGGKTIQTLDIETGEYRERREPDIPSIGEAMKIRPLPKRLEFVLKQDDKAGALARHVIYNTLGYAARRVPEITDDIINVDRAMRWGFSHDLGPFELWDALGVRATAEAMKKNGVAVAPWVTEMLAAGNESFYRDGKYYDAARRTYVAIQVDPLAIRPADQRVVRENKGASLIDIGDGVLCLEFHTKMNTLDDDVRSMIVESVAELERGAWAGMVIGNDGADFCVGANLAGGIRIERQRGAQSRSEGDAGRVDGRAVLHETDRRGAVRTYARRRRGSGDGRRAHRRRVGDVHGSRRSGSRADPRRGRVQGARASRRLAGDEADAERRSAAIRAERAADDRYGEGVVERGRSEVDRLPDGRRSRRHESRSPDRRSEA